MARQEGGPQGAPGRLFMGLPRACLRPEAPRWKTVVEAEAKQGSEPGEGGGGRSLRNAGRPEPRAHCGRN